MNLLPINWATRWLGGTRILDIGCYVGWNSGFFKHYLTSEHYVVGCDLDVGSLNRAHALLDDVVRADICNLPFKPSCFDNGMCIEVIEHLPREKGPQIVQEFKRVCDGYVFLTTPNGWLGKGLERLMDRHPLLEHKSSYTARDLIGLGACKVRGLGWRNDRSIFARWLYFLWFIPYRLPNLSKNLMALF